mmetsp:Transcript_55894/g.131065  ORF Transcript_55894/g.131065 Transcript_55894/m.131065 type:complete len:258 (-) Transcript_55894:815-1588(-)
MILLSPWMEVKVVHVTAASMRAWKTMSRMLLLRCPRLRTARFSVLAPPAVKVCPSASQAVKFGPGRAASPALRLQAAAASDTCLSPPRMVEKIKLAEEPTHRTMTRATTSSSQESRCRQASCVGCNALLPKAAQALSSEPWDARSGPASKASRRRRWSKAPSVCASGPRTNWLMPVLFSPWTGASTEPVVAATKLTTSMPITRFSGPGQKTPQWRRARTGVCELQVAGALSFGWADARSGPWQLGLERQWRLLAGLA